MSERLAQVSVFGGVVPNQTVVLRKAVARIGSDASCEVHIPFQRLKPHAATLRLEKDDYIIYNRSDDPILVDGLSVAAGQSGKWPVDSDIELLAGVSLRLQVGAASPVAAASQAKAYQHPHVASREDELESEATDVASVASAGQANSGLKDMILMAVIVVCGGVGLLMLVAPEPTGSVSGEDVNKALAKVIKEIGKQPSDLELTKVCQLLQQAKANRARGDSAAARRQLLAARERMLVRVPADKIAQLRAGDVVKNAAGGSLKSVELGVLAVTTLMLDQS